MFQRKIDKLFSGMTKVFNIANDILNAGFDELGKDHNEALGKVLQVCMQANLKLNKDKYLFMCTIIPSFGEIISW